MFSLESDETTAFSPNEILSFTFYVIISKSITNGETFAKEVFDFMLSIKSYKMTAMLPNDH